MDDSDKKRKKAFELFDKYTALLNQEFPDAQSAQHMQEQCIAIATELDRLGFHILTSVRHTHGIQKLHSGGHQVVITLEFTCLLICSPPANETQIAVSTAIAKIFSHLIPAQNAKAMSPPTTHVSQEDKEWLKSSGIAWDDEKNK